MAQSKSEVESNVMHTNRRKFMKGVTTGIVGATAIGASNNVSADIPWTSLSGAGLAFESSAIALDYLMGNGYVDEAQNRAANYIHMRYGDMRNYDGYTGETALHTEVLAGAKEMRISDKQIMNGILNQIEMSDNVGYSKGKVALIESLNAGDDITTAKSEMNNALNDYYSSIQKSILQHWKTQIAQIQHMLSRIEEHSNINLGERSANDGVIGVRADTGAGGTKILSLPYNNNTGAFFLGADGSGQFSGDWKQLANTGTASFELLNGTKENDIPVCLNTGENMVFLPYYNDGSLWSNGSNADTLNNLGNSMVSDLMAYDTTLYIKDVGTVYSSSYYGNGLSDNPDLPESNGWFTFMSYQNAMAELYTARDRVNSNLQGFADDLYANYQSGDLSLAEIVDPITYATELATNTDNDAFRQVSAAQLGFATNATENVTIQINDGDSEPVIETDLYTSHSPSGGSWSVGTQYDPSTWSEPLFITYPDDDGTNSMAQLETPFTIQSAVDKDGNSVDTFQNRETNIQTADIASIQEELEKLRQTQLELQQDSGTTNTDTPQDSDGGSGGSSTNIVDELTKKYFGFPLYGWIAGGGVVTYIGTKVGNE